MEMCKLCELHQHLSVQPITFWVEWDNGGRPYLVTDRAGLPHPLPVVYCPICGRKLPNVRQEAQAEPPKEAEGAEAADGEQNG